MQQLLRIAADIAHDGKRLAAPGRDRRNQKLRWSRSFGATRCRLRPSWDGAMRSAPLGFEAARIVIALAPTLPAEHAVEPFGAAPSVR
jgi:hypothetical protein